VTREQPRGGRAKERAPERAGVVRTEERETSDEGRRRLEGPRGAALSVGREQRRSEAMGRALRIAKLVILLAVALVFLMPVYVLVVTSFKSLSEADPSSAWSLPRHWSFEGWQAAWTALKPGLANSFKIAISGSVIAAVLGSLNGFVLSKWRFPGADAVFTLFLFGMFIPYQAVMIPLAGLLTNMELSGSVSGLVLAHVVYGIPICTLIFRNYYVTIPTELIEAADLAVHLSVERLPVRDLPGRAEELAGHRDAQQHRGLGRRGGAVQPADGLGAAGVLADTDRLRAARPLLHAGSARRGAQRLTGSD
jgi:ABC-type Fe3+ transport system permease subunit